MPLRLFQGLSVALTHGVPWGTRWKFAFSPGPARLHECCLGMLPARMNFVLTWCVGGTTWVRPDYVRGTTVVLTTYAGGTTGVLTCYVFVMTALLRAYPKNLENCETKFVWPSHQDQSHHRRVSDE